MNAKTIDCPRCQQQVGAKGFFNHERRCFFPKTFDRIFELGNVDTSTDGCWEWGIRPSNDYPQIGGRKGHKQVSRWICEIRDGRPLPDDMVARHACDNPRCVRPDHIVSGRQVDNIRDMYERGRVDREKRNAAVAASKARFKESPEYEGYLEGLSERQRAIMAARPSLPCRFCGSTIPGGRRQTCERACAKRLGVPRLA